MVKIALTGKIRSGKDSVADILVAKGFERFAFSDGIWATIQNIWGISEDYTNKPRKLLQDVGQKLREVDPYVWIDYTIHNVRATESLLEALGVADKTDIIITDLRQPNEYEVLREEGFTIIRVSAPESARKQRARARGDDFTEQDLIHETESHIDDFEVDYEIINNGTLEELAKEVERVYQLIIGE